MQNYSTADITESLRNYVVKELFWNQGPPDPKRRRYFPNKKDIHNIVGRIRLLSKFSREDQDELKKLVEQIRGRKDDIKICLNIEEATVSGNRIESSDDEEFFEPDINSGLKSKKKKEDKKTETFLFSYQTPQQQRLLMRYGNITYIVEIECSNLKRALPYEMYAFLVQTNVDYQVVGWFLTSKRREGGVVEGLNTLKKWNAHWEAKYLLVDCSEKIYNAVATVFPGK